MYEHIRLLCREREQGEIDIPLTTTNTQLEVPLLALAKPSRYQTRIKNNLSPKHHVGLRIS